LILLPVYYRKNHLTPGLEHDQIHNIVMSTKDTVFSKRQCLFYILLPRFYEGFYPACQLIKDKMI